MQSYNTSKQSRASLALATLLIALTVVGCGSEGIDTFTITEKATATVEKGTLLEQLAGDLPFGDAFLNFDVASNQEFKNQGVKKSQIDSVKLSLLKLTIASPATGQDFTFIKSLAFFIEAEGLERKRIASGGPFEEGVKSVSLALDPVEMASYVAAPKMALTTEVNGKRPQNKTTIAAEIRLRIDVNVTGLLD